MESFWILGSIAFALMLGAMSPGPTSIYVAKIQLRSHVSMAYLQLWSTGTGAAILAYLQS